jgi:hypothetical protein
MKATNRKSTRSRNGNRESGMVETDTNAVVEWAWELKSEHFVARTLLLQCYRQAKLVGLLRNVPRYRGQDIRMYPTKRDYLSFTHQNTEQK